MAKKPSVAILGSRGIPAQYGGFETFAEELAVGLVESGYEVTVFCETSKDASSQQKQYKGVTLEYADSSLTGPLRTIAIDITSFWVARKTFDVVYMLGYGAAIFAWIPRLYGTRVWINMDGLEWARRKWDYFPARRWFKLNEWAATRFASRLIADAQGIADYLKRHYKKLPPLSVIEYGAEVLKMIPSETVLSEFGVFKNTYDIVVCRLEPENHVAEIMDAYAGSGEKKLLIVGDHTVKTKYIKNLLLIKPPNVHFIGAIYDRLKLNSLRYYSRIYVHGHSVGGTNPSLLEAMAMGNVVLAHDNVFNREVLGASGLYFSNAESLRELLNNLPATVTEKGSGLRKAVKQRIESTYNWPRIVSRYKSLL